MEAERKCSPGELSKYVLNTAATKKLGGINLSGGAFNEASCELWLVRNNPMTLERFDTSTGTVLQTVTLYGGFNDPEGVCFLGPTTIVIAEERNHKLTKCELPSSGTTSLSQSSCTVLSPAITGFDPNDSNKGTSPVDSTSPTSASFLLTHTVSLSLSLSLSRRFRGRRMRCREQPSHCAARAEPDEGVGGRCDRRFFLASHRCASAVVAQGQ